MRSPVVPLVRPRHAIVFVLVPHCLPCLAAIVGTLHHLPKPPARLRRVNAIRIHRRSLQVINLPTAKMGPAHVPLLSLAVRRQDKGALLCSNEHSYSAHATSLCLQLRWGLGHRFDDVEAAWQFFRIAHVGFKGLFCTTGRMMRPGLSLLRKGKPTGCPILALLGWDLTHRVLRTRRSKLK